MRVLSLFSGLGGLDYGFMLEGFELTLACDVDPAAVETHAHNLGTRALQLDLSEHDPARLPDAEVIIGGPPCQSFSLVGRRLAEDPRSSLVLRYLDAVRIHRPLAFVMENVPGMERRVFDGEPVIAALIRKFERLGYSVVPHKVMATDYLVPQLRRRLFLLGARGFQLEPPDPDAFAWTRYGIERKAIDLGARGAIGDLGPPVNRGQRASYLAAPSRVTLCSATACSRTWRITGCPACRKQIGV